MHPPASVQDLLRAYEAMRASLPTAVCPSRWERTYDLGTIGDRYDAFCFDAFGVLNIGATPVQGAVERLYALRQTGKRVLLVSNASSVPSQALCERYMAMGFHFSPDEVVTSRDALVAHLRGELPRAWAVAAPRGADLSDLPPGAICLADDPSRIDASEGFILLTSLERDSELRERLCVSLRARPRPVLVANADLAAPYEHGFSVEPGALAQWLKQHSGVEPTLFGKPFAPIFTLVRQRLGPHVDPQRVLMVGDTLHTDVLGGCGAGLHAALVVGQGVSAGPGWEDAIELTGIVPHYVIDRI